MKIIEKKYYLRLFVKFLQDNNAYEDFCKVLRRGYKSWGINYELPSLYVNSFHWFSNPRKKDKESWEMIDSKWTTFLAENDIEEIIKKRHRKTSTPFNRVFKKLFNRFHL